MAHADYDCCAICDCKLSYAGFYNARTKEDIRKVKAILEQLNFRCCYYQDSIDDLLESRGIIFDKESGKIIGLKKGGIKVSSED